MGLFAEVNPTEPGYRCTECQTEERVTGARFTAAVEQRLNECREAGHDVTTFGGLGEETPEGVSIG
jgi:DNA polymerase III alpha subunit (gram-positive type)